MSTRRWAEKTVLRVMRVLWDEERRDFVNHTFEVTIDPNKIPTRVFTDAVRSPKGTASRLYRTIVVKEERQ